MTSSPKIVVLDGYTLTGKSVDHKSGPSESETAGPSSPVLDWSRLAEIGDLTVHDRTPEDQIPERCEHARIVITNKTPLMRATLTQLPELRYIGVLATGVNNVDLDCARERGVTVTNVPGYSTDSVAQHVFALLLQLVHHTTQHDRIARDGAWSAGTDFSFVVAPIVELAGKNFGIIGVGAIGRRVARIASSLGMKIIAAHQRSMNGVRVDGVSIEWVPLDDLLSRADVVTLHCPLNEQTHHLINERRLGLMKSSCILINTGRGPLIDESALAAGLHEHQIGGAGLDVLSVEPPPHDHPLLSAPRCVITPHVAWATVEARARLMDQVVRNVEAFLDGNPVNVVNL